MSDLIQRFDQQFVRGKDPELMELLLTRILGIRSEFVSITTLAEGKIVYVNDGVLQTTGWSKEEILGRTVHDMKIYVDPDKRNDVKSTLTEDEILEQQINVRHKNGGFVSYLLRLQMIPLFGEPCILAVGWDITRRRQLEQEVHNSLKNDLRQTVQALDNLVFKLTLGKDGRLTFELSEGKIARSMGMTTDEVYGKTLSDLFPADVMEIVQPHVEKALSGEPTSFELETGDRVIIKSLSPYYEQGRITGVVGSAIDITERKRLERLLQVSELSAVVGQLAAGAAHEIRNPLTSIKGFVQLIGEILEEHRIEKGRNYIELILSELSRINHLVTEMLWLRKPKESVYESVNIAKVLQDVLPLVYVEANLKSIQVSCHFSSTGPKINANLELLKQVILNLCKNGIDAMDSGGHLQIGETVHEQGVSIMIRDNGPGIPHDLADKLFTPFFTTKPKGNGLGLFISKQIVREMGGEIDISSDAAGTLVTVTFPLQN
ncbi:ATP-binding protein [Cohnella pontilimi]|nr:ATP-binding protein [Cohnella pontilimi]